MSRSAFLVDWNVTRATALADELRHDGWEVVIETEDGSRAYQETGIAPPGVLVIWLDAKPGHGMETAQSIHHRVATADVPIVFVCTEPSVTEKALELVPSGVVTDEAALRDILDGLG
ncbi:MAG: hypothetical protein HKN93_00340 [Acidimicrobiia bacterium]|nr:hypothetical protein [Acidimicrobiia bacterium]